MTQAHTLTFCPPTCTSQHEVVHSETVHAQAANKHELKHYACKPVDGHLVVNSRQTSPAMSVFRVHNLKRAMVSTGRLKKQAWSTLYTETDIDYLKPAQIDGWLPLQANGDHNWLAFDISALPLEMLPTTRAREHLRASLVLGGSSSSLNPEQNGASRNTGHPVNIMDYELSAEASKARGVLIAKGPSPSERGNRELLHMPSRSLCPFCISSKGEDNLHRSKAGAKKDKLPSPQTDYTTCLRPSRHCALTSHLLMDAWTGRLAG